MPGTYLAITISLAVGIVIGWLVSRARRRSSPYKRALSNIRRVSETRPPIDVPAPTAPTVRQRHAEVAAHVEGVYVLELRANLKQKVLGNETVVERLIQYEQTRNPAGHMELWVQAAIDRWEHDNRSRW